MTFVTSYMFCPRLIFGLYAAVSHVQNELRLSNVITQKRQARYKRSQKDSEEHADRTTELLGDTGFKTDTETVGRVQTHFKALT